MKRLAALLFLMLAAMIRDGMPKYAKIVKTAGVKPE